MHFGNDPGFKSWGIGQGDAIVNEKIFLRFIEAGGNFIDTANFYQAGQSEEQIGSFIKKHNIDRERLVLATKFSLPTVAGDPNAAGNHKKNLFRSVKDSLRRLGTDYIDILYVHFWDWSCPIESLTRDLNEIVKSGRVLHIGASDIPAWIVSEANTIARLRGWAPFVVYQGRYSLVDRSLEQEVFPMSRSHDMGMVPWGVLGQGKLTGKRSRGDEKGHETQRSVAMIESDFKIQDEVIAIAKEVGKSATPSQIALAWALKKTTSPLLGARTLEQFDDCMGALQINLTCEQIKRLDEVSKESPALIFPHGWNGTDSANCQWLYAPQKKYSIDLFKL